MHVSEIVPIILCTECLNYSHKKGRCRLGLNEYQALLCEEFEFPEERRNDTIRKGAEEDAYRRYLQGNNRPIPLCYPREKCSQATLL